MDLICQKIKIKPIFVCLVFLILSFGLYFPAINTWFVSDDFDWLLIARNTEVSAKIFFTNYAGETYGGSYNPLLVLIFKFFYSIFSQNHQPYHIISIIVHASNASLLYLLAKRIFKLANINLSEFLAVLAGFLFLIWPVQVETIYWLSAWPHIWTLLFYLASLLFYFKFRRENKNSSYWLSILFFILAIFIKEIAISLPFVILLWEIYFVSGKLLKKNVINNFVWLFYFIFAFLFLLIRYLSIGLLFGYYGQHNLAFNFNSFIGNLPGFLNEFVSVSFLRVIFFKIYYYQLESVVIISLSGLALYFYYLLKKKAWFNFTLFASLLISLGPVLLVGLHRTTFAGDRYLYIASIFWVLWLTYIFGIWSIKEKIKLYILLIFVVFSFGVINYKSNLWQQGAALSKQIVDSYQSIKSDQKQKFVTVGLPDNLSGAEVFRNNLGQALAFAYPDNPPEIIPLPIYVAVNSANKNSHLLKWRSDDLGWFAESVDGSFVVTGMTSIELEGFYFELWNYNYQNYTANTIRLMPREEMKAKMLSGELKILSFDRGKLKIIE